jgi:hypothetical protein
MGLPAGLSSFPKAKTTQEWLRRNVPSFISAEEWPSGSPDLKPRDYKLWAVLEHMACQKRHKNVDSLKRFLVKAAAEVPLETVRAAIATSIFIKKCKRGIILRRCQLCVCVLGSRFATVRFTTIHFYDPCPVGPSTPDLWCITVATQSSFLYLVRF